MKNIIKTIALFGILIGFGACETMNDPEQDFSSTYPVSGEWWVKYTIDGEDVYGLGYNKLTTSNTAANDGKAIWIDDQGLFWPFRVKCPVNMKSLSFSGDDLISTAIYRDQPYDIAVNVTNGKVIKKGGLSTSGVVTDSIYFEVEFEDEPGTIYEVSGVRRTGFLEDEH